MSVELWIEGVIIEFNEGNPCARAIIRSVGKNEIILADISNGVVARLSRSSLESVHATGGLKFLAESRDFGELKFADLTEKEQRETNRKYQYVKRLQQKGVSKITEKRAGEIILEVALELDENPPHWQSVRTWYKRFIESSMRGLYPKHRFKGHREPKINVKILGIIRKEAKRYYKLSQPSMASIYRNVEEKVIAYNLDNSGDELKAPSYLTVKSRVLEGCYQNKQKARKGVRAFQAELASSQSGIETSRILERVEIDHTLLDIHVLHDDHNTLLGRPNITLLIDHYSHMVLGFQISFECPSFASVSMACMNAFLPKSTFLESLGCDVPWPAHGIPMTLVTDNGAEFWGNNLSAVADEIGAVIQYCPVRKGNYKSCVERFFGRVNSMVLDDLPGVVRKAGKCGDTYDARQEAKITFTEFKRYFVKWLAEVYHNTPLEKSGMTPNEIWSASERDFPVPVEDEAELTPILMATQTRELGKGGIRIFVMDYNSDILKDLYRRDGPCKVTIKYNPFDIGCILVLDEVNKVYLKVECESYAYASGLSAFEHDKVRAVAKATGKSKFDDLDLQRGRVKLSKERDEFHARNSRRKTQVTASKAARSDKVGVGDMRLVVDNQKHIVEVGLDDGNDGLDIDGWDID